MALSKPAESNRRNQTGVSRRMRDSLADLRARVGRHVSGNARIPVDRRVWKICTEIEKYFCAYRVIDGQFYQR